jgi:hypothetical protein
MRDAGDRAVAPSGDGDGDTHRLFVRARRGNAGGLDTAPDTVPWTRERLRSRCSVEVGSSAPLQFPCSAGPRRRQGPTATPRVGSEPAQAKDTRTWRGGRGASWLRAARLIRSGAPGAVAQSPSAARRGLVIGPSVPRRGSPGSPPARRALSAARPTRLPKSEREGTSRFAGFGRRSIQPSFSRRSAILLVVPTPIAKAEARNFMRGSLLVVAWDRL